MNKIQKNFISSIGIIIFSLSIFFWDQNLTDFPLRFLYLIILPLSLYKIFSTSNYEYLILFPIASLLLIHYFVLNFFYLKNIEAQNLIKILIVIFTFIVIKTFINFIKENFTKILDFFLYFFCVYFFIYIYYHNINFEKFLDIGCSFTSGFFSNNDQIKSNFIKIFKENSHFGMMSVPLSTFYIMNLELVKKNFIKNLFIFIFLLIVFFNFSFTFFAGLLLSFFILLTLFNKKFLKNYIILALLLILSFFTILNKSGSSCEEKKNDINQMLGYDVSKNSEEYSSQNYLGLSNAVYAQAAYVSYFTLRDKPFGWGFDNYKYAYDKYYDATKNLTYSFYKEGKKYNREDGSNNLFKLVTEFGFFSLLLFIFIIIIFFSKKINPSIIFFSIPLLTTQTFFRGAGYFNGGYLIILTIIILLYTDHHKSLNNDT